MESDNESNIKSIVLAELCVVGGGSVFCASLLQSHHRTLAKPRSDRRGWGGVNLYGFVRNDGLSKQDYLGLFGSISYCAPGYNCPIDYKPPTLSYCASTASLDQHLLGLGDDLSNFYTDWYQMRFPKTTAHAKSNFTKQIDALVRAKLCRGQSFSSQEVEPIRINGYNNNEGSYPINGVTEAAFGDREQSREPHWRGSEATQVLGNYSINVRDISYQACNMCGCKKFITWSARVVVIDTLGVHPRNVGAYEDDPTLGPWFDYYLAAEFVGEQRNAIIAAWPISGWVCCK